MTPAIPFAATLWPHDPPDDTSVRGRPFLTVVRDGEVRSLLPASTPRALFRSLARSNGPETIRRHLARRAYAAAAAGRPRSATRGLVWSTDLELEQRLAELLGHDVHLAFHFGPPRANRKPVVQILDPTGRMVAVAKLGVSLLTAELVRHEAAALDHLEGRTGPELDVPRLLSLSTWDGVAVLVQTALVVPHRHVLPTTASRSAAELHLSALPVQAALPMTTYVDNLRNRVLALPSPAPIDEYVAAVDLVGQRLDLTALPSGPSHGDWSYQNVAAGAAGVAAWDWERFDPSRPHGFDAAHFRLQQLLSSGPRTQPGVSLLHEAPLLLSRWHRQDQPELARGVATLMLVDLAARYLADGQQDTGSPGSRAVDWAGPGLRTFEHPEDPG